MTKAEQKQKILDFLILDQQLKKIWDMYLNKEIPEARPSEKNEDAESYFQYRDAELRNFEETQRKFLETHFVPLKKSMDNLLAELTAGVNILFTHAVLPKTHYYKLRLNVYDDGRINKTNYKQ